MKVTERGKVQDGGLVLARPLPLPEGTEVLVQVEPVAPAPAASAGKDFAALPFFGMWAGRDDLGESADHVRREREQWHQRAQRPD
jgi:hypothetical protein